MGRKKTRIEWEEEQAVSVNIMDVQEGISVSLSLKTIVLRNKNLLKTRWVEKNVIEVSCLNAVPEESFFSLRILVETHKLILRIRHVLQAYCKNCQHTKYVLILKGERISLCQTLGDIKVLTLYNIEGYLNVSTCNFPIMKRGEMSPYSALLASFLSRALPDASMFGWVIQ